MSKQETIRVIVPATYKNLSFIGSCVQSLLRNIVEAKNIPIDELSEIAYDVELAVHEICNNIIDHAYSHENGKIVADFLYDLTNCSIIVDIFDEGKSFEPTNISSPNLDTPQEGGYGLFIAYQLLDEVTYTHDDRQNHWHLVKYL